jgi:hypothetical protein
MNYKELEQEVKRLEEQIKDLKVKLEGKVEKKPYEVEVPEDINHYYYVDADGLIESLLSYSDEVQKSIFNRGLAFKTKEEAKQFDKERILINKFKNWAKKYNGDWTHNLKDLDEGKYITRYDYEDKQYYVVYDYEDKQFYVRYEHYSETFTKLPYFKSYNLVEQFIEEFKEEIIEVLC